MHKRLTEKAMNKPGKRTTGGLPLPGWLACRLNDLLLRRAGFGISEGFLGWRP